MKKKWWVIVIVMLLIVGIGVKHHMDQVKLRDEMIQITKQNKKLIQTDLKIYDPKNRIKTIEIDDSSIEHSPMGGIIGRGYVNHDSTLSFDFGLRQAAGTNKIETSNIGPRTKLNAWLTKGSSK